jgi:hypothetical protein
MDAVAKHHGVNVGLALILAFQSAFVMAASGDCSPDAPRLEPNPVTGETCPDIGRMGPFKLAIPRNYILGPDFVYDGVDIWNAESYKNRPKTQSFDLGIKYFSIRIRLDNFKPIETENDLIDFRIAENSVIDLPPISNQSIFVTFRYPSVFKKMIRMSICAISCKDLRKKNST